MTFRNKYVVKFCIGQYIDDKSFVCVIYNFTFWDFFYECNIDDDAHDGDDDDYAAAEHDIDTDCGDDMMAFFLMLMMLIMRSF